MYVLDKKAFLHHFPSIDPQRIYDVSVYNNLNHIQNIDIPQYETAVESDFKRKYYDSSPSTLIPISKHYEECEFIFDNINSIFSISYK